jgi:hypothetical protein
MVLNVNGNTTNGGGLTEALRINTAGKVGIGTTNPLNVLQIGSSYPITMNGSYPDIHFNGYYSAPSYRTVTTGFGSRLSFNGATGKLTIKTGASSTTAGSNYSGAEVFGISAAGHVTKPFQPSFRVGRSAGNVNAGTYVVHNVVTHNVGSHYSTSNGRFTAPVAGSYQFNVRLINSSGGYNTDLAALRINGSAANAANMHDVASVSHAGNSLSTTFYLSAGDYVQVYSQSHTVYGTAEQHCQFSGHLIG